MWVFSGEIVSHHCFVIWNSQVAHRFLENLYTPALINDMHPAVRRSRRDNMRKVLPLSSAYIYNEHVAENLRYRIHNYCH